MTIECYSHEDYYMMATSLSELLANSLNLNPSKRPTTHWYSRTESEGGEITIVLSMFNDDLPDSHLEVRIKPFEIVRVVISPEEMALMLNQ